MPTRSYIVDDKTINIYIYGSRRYIDGTFVKGRRKIDLYIYGFTIVNYWSKQVLGRSLMFLFGDEKVVHTLVTNFTFVISMEIEKR